MGMNMLKVIIKHLSGSKSNQTEMFEFPVKELLFGRDAGSQVIFDPEKDDLVSRRHCKITVQNNDQFYLTDLNSRNGTFVNNQKIISPIRMCPGDTVQLGKGGPQFVFDLDPRPTSMPKVTRLGDTTLEASRTREVPLNSRSYPSEPYEKEPLSDPAPSSDKSDEGIGRNTVERLISQAEFNTRKKIINIGSGIICVIILISGFFIFQNYENKAEIEGKQANKDRIRKDEFAALRSKIAALRSNEPLNSADIFSKNSNSIVLIEASWRLIHIPTGKQLYQKIGCIRDKKRLCKTESWPWYVFYNGTVEPYLVSDAGVAVGSTVSGSGFVARASGFILTNRHVAASWQSQDETFSLPKNLKGIAYICKDAACNTADTLTLVEAFNTYPDLFSYKNEWVPSKSKCFNGHPLTEDKTIEGRNDYLQVTFPKTQQKLPARITQISSAADVAAIKIDVADNLKSVEINSQPAVTAGDPITVLSYPDISHLKSVKTNPLNPINSSDTVRTLPEPTVTGGSISKVIIEATLPADLAKSYSRETGDVYQLTVTGSGNSGGAVFDKKGKVIAISAYSKTDPAANQTSFAIPIKYGEAILGVKPAISIASE
jgi:serine protease Do